jgi:shikimate kinase
VKKNLVLVGMMASGKTTLGKIIAKKQNLKFIDTDLNIEKINSMTIREIFEKKGEKFFRIEEEKETLKSLKKNNFVISLGGGAFMNKKIRESVLKNSISIWLDVDAKTIKKRIRWNDKRPLLDRENNLEKLNKLYSERKDAYKKAKYKIACKDLNKNILVKKILNLYDK